MTNTNTNTNRTIAMFHVGRGGRFGNAGHLTFVGFKPIDDSYEVENLFIHENEFDEYGNPIEVGVFDCSGKLIMSIENWHEACRTGIGRIDIDGAYDTTYTEYVDSLSENELEAMAAYGGQQVLNALMEFGYSCEEVAVAEYFSELESLVEYKTGGEYISFNYDVIDAEPEDGDFFEFDGKFYVKS